MTENQQDMHGDAVPPAKHDRDWLIQTTQRLHDLQSAVGAGRFRVSESQSGTLNEVMGISLQPGQLLDPESCSPDALGLIRTVAMALRFIQQQEEKPAVHADIGLADSQTQLFGHFATMFAALAGQSYDTFPTEVELAAAARTRAARESQAADYAFRRSCDDLGAFYRVHATTLWSHARNLGGLKLVLGGQRAFGPSAFRGVQKMALYADTQLIADPIFPFFEGELDLKAKYVELLRQLYRILHLTPFVNARLHVPPVLVFPSFEKALETSDVRTQVGINDLVLQTVGVTCGFCIDSMDDLRRLISADPSRFVSEIMRAQLFLPPGVVPGEINDANAAVKRYLAELGSYRKAESVEQLSKMPIPSILMIGITERFAPQYHLLENANELTAQPMLTQDAHWHFFEKAAGASATALHRKEILSADGFRALKALQHDRLAWLENVPIPALVELLANQENLAFRKELGEHTKALTAAGVDDLDRTVREICHAIESLVQRHQKTIGEIEAKYSDKYKTTWIAGGGGVAVGAAASFMPFLSAFGAAAPLVAGAGMLGKLAVDAFGKRMEIKRARTNLLGVLATTPKR